jgi:hypothetical protein
MCISRGIRFNTGVRSDWRGSPRQWRSASDDSIRTRAVLATKLLSGRFQMQAVFRKTCRLC